MADAWFFCRIATVAAQVYVMNADGTGATRLTHDLGRKFAPVWTDTSSE